MSASSSVSAPRFAHLAVLDAADAQRRLGGSVRVWSTAARVFLRDAPQQLEQLRMAASAGRADVALRAAHSIKGSAAWIGARRTEAAALALEQALQAGGAAPQDVALLDDALWDALTALEDALESH